MATDHLTRPGHLLNDHEALVMALILRDVRKRRADADTAHADDEPTGGEVA